MLNYLNWRRAIGGLIGVAGLIFLGFGGVEGHGGIGAIGVAFWLLLATGIAVGLRFRIAKVLQLGSQIKKWLAHSEGIREASVRNQNVFFSQQMENQREFFCRQLERQNEIFSGQFKAQTNSLTELLKLQGELISEQYKSENERTISGLTDLKTRFDDGFKELNSSIQDGDSLTLRVFRELIGSIEGQQSALSDLERFSQNLSATAEKGMSSIRENFSGEIDKLREELNQLNESDFWRQQYQEFKSDILSKLATELEKSNSKYWAYTQNRLNRAQIDIVQNVEASRQLERVLDSAIDHPLSDGWAMDAISTLSLVKEILNRKPKLVVEFGSGTSTFWIASALRKNGVGKIISFEHLDWIADQNKSMLVENNLAQFAEIRVAPLEEMNLGGEDFLWYSTKHVHDAPKEIDMLIVDGPPANTCDNARFPAFPTLIDHLSEGAIVVVDDMSRNEEKEMVERWQALSPQLSFLKKLGRATWCYAYLKRDQLN